MGGGRGRALIGAALCFALLALAVPAAHAAKAQGDPGLKMRIVSKKQRTILDRNRIAVRIKARNHGTLLRVFGSFRRRSKNQVPVVATRIRELKIGHNRNRKVILKLTKAGRNALKSCARARIVITAAPLLERGGAPAKRRRKRNDLRRDPKLCGKKPDGGGGGNGGGGGGGGGGPKPQAVNYTPENPARCDWIDGADCLFPWPNDHFTTGDSTTDTGRRLNLNILSMPRNRENKPVEPTPYNRNDGFSPGSMIVTKVPGLETKAAFQKSAIVPIDDMGQAFRPGQPVVVIDTKTLARHLVWAEVDANPGDPNDVTLIIRPGRNLNEGRRYIAALRNLKDASGKTLQPTTGFKLYRDANPTSPRNAAVEGRRAHYEGLFRTLAEAGIPRGNLYRAWDFTVASERNLSERMLSIRDDAFMNKLGDKNLTDMKVEGAAPQFTVTKVEQTPTDEELHHRVEGTFTVPCYLDAPDCPAGSQFAFDPTKTNGPPVQIPGNTMEARFSCIVPKKAHLLGGARPSLYGHGLLGSRGEVGQGQAQDMAEEHNFVYCATEWIGMACGDLPDIPDFSPDGGQEYIQELFGKAADGTLNLPNCDYQTIVAIENDVSLFPKLADRVQQGMLNFLYLGRLMRHPQGFNSHAGFKTVANQPMLDTTRTYYDGNSQGGIIGGSLMSMMVDGDRGVLGVPGMNYSTLLQRSTDWGTGQPPDPSNPDLPEYSYLFYESYPDELQRPLMFSLMQLLWDRGEANGYAHHMTDDPYPNTPPHEVMLHVGLGDHQVAQITAETEARTIGASARFPYAAAGRDLDKVNPIFGAPPIAGYPFAGSAIVLWDIGPPRKIGNEDRGTPPPPNENVPPSEEFQDPHEFPRRQPEGREQKSAFMSPGGKVIDVCGPLACLADPTL